jgi:hypothetical protein
LSEKIAAKKIWNPTLKELIDYLAPLENLEFDITIDGSIYLKSESNFITRAVTI